MGTHNICFCGEIRKMSIVRRGKKPGKKKHYMMMSISGNNNTLKFHY